VPYLPYELQSQLALAGPAPVKTYAHSGESSCAQRNHFRGLVTHQLAKVRVDTSSQNISGVITQNRRGRSKKFKAKF